MKNKLLPTLVLAAACTMCACEKKQTEPAKESTTANQETVNKTQN